MAPKLPRLESRGPRREPWSMTHSMTDAQMDESLKSLRQKTRKGSPTRRLPTIHATSDEADEVPAHKRYGGPPPRKKTQAELQKERKMQIERELDCLNLSLSSTAKRPAPALMPVLDLSSKNRRSQLHASGAQTERLERKALHEHKVPYRPAAGSLNSDVYSAILDLGDFSDFPETRSMAAPPIWALASQLQNRNALADSGALDVMLALAAGTPHQCGNGGAESGSPRGKRDGVNVRLESWHSILDMLESPIVAKRLVDMPNGLRSVMSCAIDAHLRVRSVGAQVLERIVLSKAMPVQERSAPHMIDALGRFLRCGDDVASLAAGKALLGIAQASVAQGHVWDKRSVVLLASAVAAGVSLSGKVMSRESSAASLTSLTSLHTSLPAASSPRAEHDGSEEGEAAEEHKKQLEVEAGAHACPSGSEGEHAPLAIKMEHVGREGEDEDEGDYESEEESGGGTLGRDHRCLGRRDCAHALEVLASDRRNRVMMTREQTYSILPLLFKGLMRHGEEVARGALSGRSGFKSQADYHLVKTMSLLVSSTTIQALSRFDLPASDLGIERSSLRLSQSPLQALIRCMPRLRIALKDSFPRHMAAHKGGGGGGGGGGGASMLLPREAASQLAISQLLAKLALCLPACRAPLLRAGMLPELCRLCAYGWVSEVVGINASSTLFYLAHAHEARVYFCWTGAAHGGSDVGNGSWGGEGESVSVIDCLVQTLGRKTTCAQVKVAVIKTICTLLHAPDGELAGRRDNGGTDIGESGGAGGGDGGGGESVATQGELLRMVWRSSGLQVLSGLLAHALVSAGRGAEAALFIELKIGFLAADVLRYLVEAGVADVAEDVRQMDLAAWVEKVVLDIVRRHPKMARQAMADTRCLHHTLIRLEEEDATLHAAFTRHQTPQQARDDPDEARRVRQLFFSHDTDKSGALETDELHQLLRELGHLCMPDETLRIMSQMDTDGDGKIGKEEFFNWWYYVQR